MKMPSQKTIKEKYFRKEMFPSIFCPGCGNGMIMNYTARAIENLGMDLSKFVFVSGIGCSSRIPAYFNANGIHTTHGRALPYATGIKLAKPDLNIVVFTGDGDCISIGGNHFIHAIRRNINLTVIVSNNYIYGMTGGQLAPTTPTGNKSTTSLYGSIEHVIDISRTARVLGAPYVARWTVGHPHQAIKSIEKAITKEGFSLVEMLSPGPVCYGKRNVTPDPSKLLKWYMRGTVLFDDKEGKMPLSQYFKDMENEMVIGEFVDKEKKDFGKSYMELVEGLKDED